MKTLLATLKKNQTPYAGFFVFYIAAALIISATVIGGQILIGEMGQAAYQFDTSAIINFLLILTGVVFVRAFFSALSALLSGRFSGNAEYSLRMSFVKFFVRQPFAKFEKTSSGENLSVFTNDIPQATQLVSTGVLQIVSDFMLLFVVLGYMFYMNWLYTLIFVASFPVLVLIQVIVSVPIQKVQKIATDARAGFNAVVNDSLQNTATVISYALEDELESRYVSQYRKFFDARMIYIRRFAVLVLAGFIISVLPLIYLFIAAGFAVVNETMPISEFIVYTGIGTLAVGWLAELAQSLGGLSIWKASAKRLAETTTGDDENLGNREKIIPSGKLAVSFENISFSYAGDCPNVLSGVSFEIRQGAKVAIAGGSGSGKSTILKILLGLYEPEEGKVTVLGSDAAKIGKSTLREAFAYVPQDSFLFPVSIVENITNEKQVTHQNKGKLEKACSDAGILEFINSLPDGFDSILSESAENVSGGQRQRLAMARAFYKDSPIILFDEATSSLDPTTEAEILKTLENATKDKTVIMVAHRAAARAFCDTVITLNGGMVV